MRAFLTCLLLIALPLPAAAQELAARYMAMGNMAVSVEGQEHRLVIPFDKEKNRAYALEKDVLGHRSVNLLARTVGTDGAPARPMMQLTFWVEEGTGELLSAEFFDDQGMSAPLVANSDFGSAAFTEFTMTEENKVTAAFSGRFLRMENYTSQPQVAQGVEPVEISGEFEVVVAKP